MTEIFPDVLRHAGEAQESILAMSRVAPDVLTAPVAFDVIDELEGLSCLLPTVFSQISTGLTRALTKFETYENDGGDPEVSTATARAVLSRAAELASQLGLLLDEAKTAVSEQGHRRIPQ